MTTSQTSTSICRPIIRTVFFINKIEGIPDTLRQKLQLIQSNGGKKKLDLEIQIIKKND